MQQQHNVGEVFIEILNSQEFAKDDQIEDKKEDQEGDEKEHDKLATHKKEHSHPVIKAYCNQAVLRHLTHTLSVLCGLNREEKKQLLSMFTRNPIHHIDRQGTNEVTFSFWGFVRSDEMRMHLIKFLNCTLRPKVFLVGETKQHFIEGIMIVKQNILHTTSNDFEEWLDNFFSKLKMSAGTNIFTEYLGDQMLTSMERVKQSMKICSNIHTNDNADFMSLYELKLKMRREKEYVMMMTGISFTAQEFVNVFHMRGGTFRASENLTRNSTVRDGVVRPIPLSIRSGLSERPLTNDYSPTTVDNLDFTTSQSSSSTETGETRRATRERYRNSINLSFSNQPRNDTIFHPGSHSEHNYTVLMRYTR